MAENEKKHGFLDIVKEGLSYISSILSSSVLPQIVEGTELVMKTIDDRILKIEKRIIKKISALLVIGLGVLFLIIAVLFFLIDYLKISNAVAFLIIGIIVFITGLMLKIGESSD